MVHLWGRIMTKHALLAAVAALTAAASMTPASAADPAAIARGKYLVTIGSCHDCHTPGYFLGKPDMARFLGGSEVGFEIPGLGVFHGPNLTPDKATGLGDWTDAQIVAAIQKGQRPDGRMLAPIMPWHAFANLTKPDVDAVVVVEAGILRRHNRLLDIRRHLGNRGVGAIFLIKLGQQRLAVIGVDVCRLRQRRNDQGTGQGIEGVRASSGRESADGGQRIAGGSDDDAGNEAGTDEGDDAGTRRKRALNHFNKV